MVAKPVRGRGSHGVKMCHSRETLTAHIQSLHAEGSSLVMVEEFLPGEEGTVAVMPPSSPGNDGYRAMPFVARFNHHDGVAPYNGTVAVTANSRVVSAEEAARDPAYAQVAAECVRVAGILHPTAPIRIDVRRAADGRFRLFDINLKPVRLP